MVLHKLICFCLSFWWFCILQLLLSGDFLRLLCWGSSQNGLRCVRSFWFWTESWWTRNLNLLNLCTSGPLSLLRRLLISDWSIQLLVYLLWLLHKHVPAWLALIHVLSLSHVWCCYCIVIPVVLPPWSSQSVLLDWGFVCTVHVSLSPQSSWHCLFACLLVGLHSCPCLFSVTPCVESCLQAWWLALTFC